MGNKYFLPLPFPISYRGRNKPLWRVYSPFPSSRFPKETNLSNRLTLRRFAAPAVCAIVHGVVCGRRVRARRTLQRDRRVEVRRA